MPAGGRRPGRPPRTSIQGILDAAEAMGLNNVTRAGVALRLGVSAATIRHHVESTSRLYSLACARVFDRLDVAADEAVDWRDYLSTIGHRFADLVTAHPGLEDYVLRGPYERNTLDQFERILAELVRRNPRLDRSVAHLLGSRVLILSAALRASSLDRYPAGTHPPAGAADVFAWTLRAFLRGAESLLEQGDVASTTPTPDAAWTHIETADGSK